MTLAWSAELSVGFPEIDAQHEELLRRAGALHAAMKRGDRHEGARLLGFLGEYVRDHFAAEERTMAATWYPHLAAHRAEHEAFATTYRTLRQRYERHGPTARLALDLEVAVGDWLRTHFRGPDLAMGAFLKGQPGLAAFALGGAFPPARQGRPG